ncbi:hypothetical protein Cfor_11078, partial [Coptotermes formosanus]
MEGILPQKLMRNFSSTEFPDPAETGNRPRAPAVAPTIPIPSSVSPPPLGVGGTSPIIIRAEEALIVLLVLVLWIAAIALFFNRWGKIRMLEPYQPKFQQQHRSSCPMVDMNGPIGLQVTVTSSFNSRVCDAIQSHANYGKRYSTAWNDVARAVYAIIRTSRRVAASCA